MKLFLDIDTQIDFLFAAGALYAPEAERVIGPVARLNRYAADHGIPLISTMCAHPEDSREFEVWPPHCVIGTFGQQKPAATRLEKQIVIPNREVTLSEHLPGSAQQIIVEKDDLDVFSNPNILALLDRIGADEFFVYGVFTEYCVRCAAMGLLERRRGKVFLIPEAIAAVDEEKGRKNIEEFERAGATIVTSEFSGL